MAIKPRLNQNRIAQHIAHKDDKSAGGGAGRALRGLSLPDYKPADGANRLNVIPFPVKNPLYPPVRLKELEIGDWESHLDVFVHSRIGEGNRDFLCLKQFGKSCPCCIETSKLYDEADRTGDEKLRQRAKDFQAKRRSFFLVQPIIKGEPGEIHLWNASFFSFTEGLLKEANDNPAGGGPVNYADPEVGKMVYFRTEPHAKLKKALVYSGYKFLERDTELEIDWEKVPSLDEAMVIPTAEEMEAAMFGAPARAPEEEPPTPPAQQERPATKPDPDAFGEPDPRSQAQATQPSTPAVTSAPPATPAPSTPAPSAPSGSSACPSGLTYGKDNGMSPKCSGCPVFNDCLDAG